MKYIKFYGLCYAQTAGGYLLALIVIAVLEASNGHGGFDRSITAVLVENVVDSLEVHFYLILLFSFVVFFGRYEEHFKTGNKDIEYLKRKLKEMVK